MNASIRDATKADIARIVALVTSAYRGDASRAGWTTEADLLDGQRTDPEEIAALIADASGAVLLVERAFDAAAPAIVACCRIARVSPGERLGERAGGSETEDEHEGYFGMFAVEPTLQGGGVGHLLLGEAERALASRFGCTTCVMTVIDQRHELIAWYERRGYARTGVYKPFPYGDERFGVPRRADLRFVVLQKRIRPVSGAVLSPG